MRRTVILVRFSFRRSALPERGKPGTSSRPAERWDAGGGSRTLTPPEGTPDFKSGAYDRFRHPGAARIASQPFYSFFGQLNLEGIFFGGVPITIAYSSCSLSGILEGLPA